MFAQIQIGEGGLQGILQQIMSNPVWLALAGFGIYLIIQMRKKPVVPPPAVKSEPTQPAFADPVSLARFATAADALHDAVRVVQQSQMNAAAAGQQAFDPNAIMNLLVAIQRFWPLIKLVAGLFGLNLPDLPQIPVNPSAAFQPQVQPPKT